MPGEAGLRFGLLGPLAAWHGDSLLELGSPQQQAVLALLLLRRNQIVRSEAIVDALWPANVPANGLQTVRTYVFRLRKVFSEIESSPLMTEEGGYRLLAEDGRIDSDRFEALAEDGRSALLRGRGAAAERMLSSALALIRGRPLEGLDDLEAFRPDRERLQELRLLAEEDVAEARLAQGKHRELVPDLRALVEAEPYRERRWAQLMLALYRAGRQVEALAAYREARATLNSLGLEPGRELRRLERMILLQERTLDHGVVGRMHGVPRPETSYVGHEDAIAEVQRLVRRARLVSLVGPAGVGKSRLASEVVPRLRRTFPDGVWWGDLGSTRQGEVQSAVADLLAAGGIHNADPELGNRLRGLNALLVLDNCEHVLEEAAELVESLDGAAGIHILVTSREPLRVGVEHVVAVHPLSLPELPNSLEQLLESEALQLLLSRAGLASERIGAEQAAELATVVTLLDGLPLAIELAARRLGALSASELAQRLEHQLEFLSTGDRTAPARQRTLEAAIRSSYELLSEEERLALLRLAVFRGSFDAEAAEVVCGAGALTPASVLPLLLRLVDQSLLSVQAGDPSRYRLLATTRAFASSLAAERGELQDAMRRHRDYFLVRCEEVARHMIGVGLPRWLPIAHTEHQDLLAALRWSLENREEEAALELASALGFYWCRTSYLSEGRVLLERALGLAPTTSRWRERGLVALAGLAVDAEAPDAVSLSRAAVDLAPQDEELQALAFFWLAYVLLAQPSLSPSELAEAQDAIHRLRSLSEQLENAELPAVTEQLLGLASFRRGELVAARRHLERARDAFRGIRGTLDAGWTLVGLAQVALALEDAEAAYSAASDAVADFRKRRNPRGLASSFTALGRAYVLLGDNERAAAVLTEAVELAELHDYRNEAAAAAAEAARLEGV